jgi:hypothetical protein
VGFFAQAVSGPYTGRYGVLQSLGDVEDGDDGYPKTAVLRTRDDADENLIVNYNDLRPTTAGRR